MKTKKRRLKQPLPKSIGDHERPVPFDPTFKWAKRITFTAQSFRRWVSETMPIIDAMSADERIPVGNKVFFLKKLPLWHYSYPYLFAPRPVPTRSLLEIYRGDTVGRIGFDAPVNIPVLAESDGTPWMSLTPNEILTLRGSIRRSRGNVGIAGLGLGWVARKVLQRTKVTHLTVYETDEHVLKVFGTPLVEEFGDRVELIHADAYETDWMTHDVALWDIWKQFGTASYDSRYLKIRDAMRNAGKVCVGWGEGL